jgi:hypothetical protein
MNDLTLLDEFERNTGVVLDILESSLKTIAKWHEDLGKTDLRFIAQRTRNDVIGILESFHPFADAFPQILRFLTIHIPEFKSKVEDGYAHIKDKIKEIVHKYGQDPLNVLSEQAKSWVGDLYVEMCELRRYIENLSEDLSFCIRTAREQHRPHKEDVANGTLSIWAKIKVWLKNVAEKGMQILTKSFWEALFDQIRPK